MAPTAGATDERKKELEAEEEGRSKRQRRTRRQWTAAATNSSSNNTTSNNSNSISNKNMNTRRNKSRRRRMMLRNDSYDDADEESSSMMLWKDDVVSAAFSIKSSTSRAGGIGETTNSSNKNNNNKNKNNSDGTKSDLPSGVFVMDRTKNKAISGTEIATSTAPTTLATTSEQDSNQTHRHHHHHHHHHEGEDPNGMAKKKLKFPKELFGREAELRQLHEIYARICQEGQWQEHQSKTTGQNSSNVSTRVPLTTDREEEEEEEKEEEKTEERATTTLAPMNNNNIHEEEEEDSTLVSLKQLFRRLEEQLQTTMEDDEEEDGNSADSAANHNDNDNSKENRSSALGSLHLKLDETFQTTMDDENENDHEEKEKDKDKDATATLVKDDSTLGSLQRMVEQLEETLQQPTMGQEDETNDDTKDDFNILVGSSIEIQALMGQLEGNLEQVMAAADVDDGTLDEEEEETLGVSLAGGSSKLHNSNKDFEKSVKCMHSHHTTKGGSTQTRPPFFVLVEGYLGCGKSALVHHLAKEIKNLPGKAVIHTTSCNDTVTATPEKASTNSDSTFTASIRPCHFLYGKFDQHHQHYHKQHQDEGENTSGRYGGVLLKVFDEFIQTVWNDQGQGGQGHSEECTRLEHAMYDSILCGDDQNERAAAVDLLVDWLPSLRPILTRLESNPPSNSNSTERQEKQVNTNTSITTTSSITGTTIVHNKKDDVELSRHEEVFKRFIRTVCQPSRPVLLFLDDIHWIDEESQRIVSDLIADDSIHNLMVVGAYRSNEVSSSLLDDAEGHTRCSTLLHQWNMCNHSTRVIQLELPDLSKSALRHFVAKTLEFDDQPHKSWELADALYRKTKGNIFYARQALQQLQQQEALQVSMMTMCWTWDRVQIDQVLEVSNNIVDIGTSKIPQLPDKLQMALALAAFMKSTFDAELLLDLMVAEGHSIDKAELLRLLEIAVVEGILLFSNRSRYEYKFVHDRFKEASESLVPAGYARNALLIRIGKFLIDRGNSSRGEDWMLFVAVDHLNSIERNAMEPLQMVRVNLQVGEKAVQVSAFVPAAAYLQKAIDVLQEMDDEPWKNHYEVTLHLYRTAADVELCLGRFDKGSALCQLVLDNSKSINQMLRINLSLANAMGRHERHEEAVETHLKALYAIGAFPKRFRAIRILRSLLRVKKQLKKHSDYQILLLPPMLDPQQLAAMEHLTSLSIRAFHCLNMPMSLLCILLQILMTFKYGVSPDVPCAFAAYGTMLCGMFGDQEGGQRMGRLACDMLEKTRLMDQTIAKNRECQVLSLLSIYIDAWSVPLPRVLEVLQRAYKLGMEGGDLEAGFRCWSASSTHAYAAGFPLGPIRTMDSELWRQMHHYRVESISKLHQHYRFTIWHLTGSGIPIDWSEVDRAPTGIENIDLSESFRWSWFYWSRLQLAFYFDKIELAEKMIEPFRALSGIDSSYIVQSLRIFFSGLTLSVLARRTGKLRYRQRAKRVSKEMKKIMLSRGLNNLHRYLLMQACLEACEKRPRSHSTTIKESFDRAISAAGKAGFIQDAALGNELAGEYFLEMGDDFWPCHYLTRAHELYLEWGAKGKARHLRRKRREYLDVRTTARQARRLSSTGSLRRWVSGDASDVHMEVNLEQLHGSGTPFTSSDASFSVTAQNPAHNVGMGAADLNGCTPTLSLAARRNFLATMPTSSRSNAGSIHSGRRLSINTGSTHSSRLTNQ